MIARDSIKRQHPILCLLKYFMDNNMSTQLTIVQRIGTFTAFEQFKWHNIMLNTWSMQRINTYLEFLERGVQHNTLSMQQFEVHLL